MSDKTLTALITGGNSGIGLETVRLFLDAGLQVITADLQTDCLESSFGRSDLLEFHALDLTKPAQMERFCRSVISRAEPVDVLINNAGYSIRGMLENVPLEDIKKLFDINVFAVVRLIQTCLPGMRKQRSGTIINISSIAGKFTFPGNGSYSAAKHAVEALSDALRHEVSPFGIRVVAVRPAFIATAFNRTAVAMSDQIPSGGSDDAYASISKRATNALNGMWQTLKPIEPQIVASALLDIVRSDSPRAAYSIGPMAEEFLTKRAALDDDEWKTYMDQITGLEDFGV